MEATTSTASRPRRSERIETRIGIAAAEQPAMITALRVAPATQATSRGVTSARPRTIQKKYTCVPGLLQMQMRRAADESVVRMVRSCQVGLGLKATGGTKLVAPRLSGQLRQRADRFRPLCFPGATQPRGPDYRRRRVHPIEVGRTALGSQRGRVFRAPWRHDWTRRAGCRRGGGHWRPP